MNLDGFLLVVRKTDFEKSANRFLKLDEDKLTIKLRVYRLPDVNHGGFSGDEANQSCPALRIVSQFRPTKSLSSRTVRMGAMLIGRRRAGRGAADHPWRDAAQPCETTQATRGPLARS